MQNINRMLIAEAETFNKKNKGQIAHEIWHKNRDLLSFEDMVSTSIEERKNKPFLQRIFRYINQKKIGTPLAITLKTILLHFLSLTRNA